MISVTNLAWFFSLRYSESIFFSWYACIRLAKFKKFNLADSGANLSFRIHAEAVAVVFL